MSNKKSKQSKMTCVIIGEGITEKHYINTFNDYYFNVNIAPRIMNKKASDINTLKQIIIDSLEKGYEYVFCLIDMDTKTEGKNAENYQKVRKNVELVHRKKYSDSKLFFIESERCTEMWFLFHFFKNRRFGKFDNYSKLEKELQEFIPNYSKTDKFLKQDLYKILTTGEGSLENAISNAELSLKDKAERPYSYSNMNELFDILSPYRKPLR